MQDNNYNIEERDDERTVTGELIQDYSKAFVMEEEFDTSGSDYVKVFRQMIDACGKIAYNRGFKTYLAVHNKKMEKIASDYRHDIGYYIREYDKWKRKAIEFFAVFEQLAPRFGYEVPIRNDFLNSLTASADRRSAYRCYLDTCERNGTTLSPAELEIKFQKRLRRRVMYSKA